MKTILALSILLAATPALADTYTKQGLVEPKLRLAGKHDVPTVALTFDACMGATDPRILDTLINQKSGDDFRDASLAREKCRVLCATAGASRSLPDREPW